MKTIIVYDEPFPLASLAIEPCCGLILASTAAIIKASSNKKVNNIAKSKHHLGYTANITEKFQRSVDFPMMHHIYFSEKE